jgi:hypothetical protein
MENSRKLKGRVTILEEEFRILNNKFFQVNEELSRIKINLDKREPNEFEISDSLLQIIINDEQTKDVLKLTDLRKEMSQTASEVNLTNPKVKRKTFGSSLEVNTPSLSLYKK